ncbi:MAG: DUF6510 family protein [Candidatus Methylomirabilales bacterium]
MRDDPSEPTLKLVLDGNAAAAVLQDVFGLEMTDSPTECAHCGNVAEIGTLLAYGQEMGAVLRCSVCENVVIRIVETPDAIYLDARGTTYLRLERPDL